jgi:hypothetical protein
MQEHYATHIASVQSLYDRVVSTNGTITNHRYRFPVALLTVGMAAALSGECEPTLRSYYDTANFTKYLHDAMREEFPGSYDESATSEAIARTTWVGQTVATSERGHETIEELFDRYSCGVGMSAVSLVG